MHFDLIPTTAYAIYPSRVYVTGMKLGWECLYRKATNLLQVTIDALGSTILLFFFFIYVAFCFSFVTKHVHLDPHEF